MVGYRIEGDRAGAGGDREQIGIDAGQAIGQGGAGIRIGGRGGIDRARAVLGQVGCGATGQARRLVDIGDGDGHRLGSEVSQCIGGGHRYIVNIIGTAIHRRLEIRRRLERDGTDTVDIEQGGVSSPQGIGDCRRIGCDGRICPSGAVLGKAGRSGAGEYRVAVVDEEAGNHLPGGGGHEVLPAAVTGDGAAVQTDCRDRHCGAVARRSRSSKGQGIGVCAAGIGSGHLLATDIQSQNRGPHNRNRFADGGSEGQGIVGLSQLDIGSDAVDHRCADDIHRDGMGGGETAAVRGGEDDLSGPCLGERAADHAIGGECDTGGQPGGGVGEGVIGIHVAEQVNDGVAERLIDDEGVRRGRWRR